MDDLEAQKAQLVPRYRDCRSWQRPLQPPYSEEEVAALEAVGEFDFPPLLRWYLLTVSRETACSGYRRTVRCSTPLRANVVLKESMDGRYLDGVDDVAADEDRGEGSESDDGPSLDDGTITLGCDGCSSGHAVVVKGLGRGSMLDYRGEGYRVDFGPDAVFDWLMRVRPDSRRCGEDLQAELAEIRSQLGGLRPGRHVFPYDSSKVVLDVTGWPGALPIVPAGGRVWRIDTWRDCFCDTARGLQEAAAALLPAPVLIEFPGAAADLESYARLLQEHNMRAPTTAEVEALLGLAGGMVWRNSDAVPSRSQASGNCGVLTGGSKRGAATPDDDLLLLEAQKARLLALYRSCGAFQPRLLPPYSEAEAAAIEAASEFAFPPILRWYLVTVSRETTCSGYRETVGCFPSPLEPNRLLKESMHGCFVRVDGTDGQCGDEECDDVEDRDAGEVGDPPRLNDGTLQLGHDGCASSHKVVVKGQGIGSVLEWMDFCDCYTVDFRATALFDWLARVRPDSERSRVCIGRPI